jgi:periplasmic protein TonB
VMDRAESIREHHAGPMAVSWLVSCLLHGGFVAGALFFIHSMQLAPQTHSFQWDVAMAAPRLPSPETLTSTRSEAAPAPSPQRSSSLTRSRQPNVMPPVPSPTPTAEFATAPPHGPVPSSSPSTNDQKPQALNNEQNQQDLSTSTEASLPPQIETPATPSSPIDSRSSETTASIPPTQPVSVRKDYGWLTEQMIRWVEDLDKRYPATLRADGAQGKVMFIAMLHADGSLSDVRVSKSSGNSVLDQVALEDVKSGPPVTLSQPLERPQMSVKFSIVYDLKTPR